MLKVFLNFIVLFEDNNIILLLTDFDINSATQKGENE